VSRLVALVLALAVALLVLPAAARAAEPAKSQGSVVAVGGDAHVNGPAERVIVVGGDAHLGPRANVSGDVIVLFGSLERAPGAQIGGSQYVLHRDVIDWIPGPGWFQGLVLVALLLIYRIAAWGAVLALASALVRTASFERWSRGWEGRPLVALGIGLVAVAVLLPVLALVAVTGFLLPVALIGLAGLLLAAGAGLALLREGPMWPRRPGRLAYAAYLVLPPALEVGLIITSAAGLGAALRLPARRRARHI
jgi:hypothetical protein